MFDFAAQFDDGLGYESFLAKFGTEEHRRRWATVHAAIRLTDAQRELLAGFRRPMKVLCLAVLVRRLRESVPDFRPFRALAPATEIRYFDRDAAADLADQLKICGGSRVPVLIFLSEDGQFVGLYGDRTLAKYRRMAADQLGASCPTGLVVPDTTLTAAVVGEWLDEFERVQLLLRLSPRLRQLHGD